MTIPAYIKDIMGRSSYYYGFEDGDQRCGAGYTVRVRKPTDYTQAQTFRSEIERLKKWVERQTGGTCEIIRVPTATHYCHQYAVVTIWDPVMKNIEEYMEDNKHA